MPCRNVDRLTVLPPPAERRSRQRECVEDCSLVVDPGEGTKTGCKSGLAAEGFHDPSYDGKWDIR